MTGCVSTIQRRNPWIIFVKVVCKKLVHCRGLSTWLWLGEQITKCLPRLRFPRFVPPTFVETIASKEISCQENNIYIFESSLSILFKEFVRKKKWFWTTNDFNRWYDVYIEMFCTESVFENFPLDLQFVFSLEKLVSGASALLRGMHWLLQLVV